MSLFRRSNFKDPVHLHFRPPLNWKDLPEQWFEKKHFEEMSLPLKRFYGERFGLTCDNLDDAQLDEIFLQDYDVPDMPLPMVPGLEWQGQKGRPYMQLAINEDYNPKDDENDAQFCGDPEDGEHYRPWLPREPCPDGKLRGPVDEYDEPEPVYLINDNPTWTPLERIEIPLVYPPPSPKLEVAGKVKLPDGTYRIVFKPLPDDWLYAMLDEQSARHEKLKYAFTEAKTEAEKATMELTMLRKILREEQEKSDELLDLICSICGPKYVDIINQRTNRGLQLGELFDKEELEKLEKQEKESAFERKQRRIKAHGGYPSSDEEGSGDDDGGNDDGGDDLENDYDEGIEEDYEEDDDNGDPEAEEDEREDMYGGNVDDNAVHTNSDEEENSSDHDGNTQAASDIVTPEDDAEAHTGAVAPHTTASSSSTLSGVLGNTAAGLKQLGERWFPKKRPFEEEYKAEDMESWKRCRRNLAPGDTIQVLPIRLNPNRPKFPQRSSTTLYPGGPFEKHFGPLDN